MSLVQPIGHVEMLRDQRKRLVSHLSPAAKHRHFPKIYARPVPIVDVAKDWKAENERLSHENAKLRRAIDYLKLELQALQKSTSTVTILSVMRTFCDACEKMGRSIEGQSWSVEHLKSPRRARDYAWPRHVAMWLCRVIITEVSHPKLGHHFGGRDHTSSLHACRHAPEVMERDANLHAIAQIVLAAFPKKAA